MCGIFGLVVPADSTFSAGHAEPIIRRLFRLSESRGKEASGFAVMTDETIHVHRSTRPASALVRSKPYRRLVRDYLAGLAVAGRPLPRDGISILGHARLATNGLQSINTNNQPVIKDGVVGVHNGIIVNDRQLWRRHPQLRRRFDVDTEVILGLLRMFHDQHGCTVRAVRQTFDQLEGSASVAALFDDLWRLVLATNTGSLYLLSSKQPKLHIFASERHVLERVIRGEKLERRLEDWRMDQVPPGTGCMINLREGAAQPFAFGPHRSGRAASESPAVGRARPRTIALWGGTSQAGLRRCSRCILPETMPSITFDGEGICNYCRTYRPYTVRGPAALAELVTPYRRRDGRPDCLVMLSGGRDSTYMLHYVKRVLGMHPICYTYDWGMITDLARRNQARVCGKLGVEQIIVSADIKKKRANIRRNIEAWLKRPELGMVPLFMAGDKQYLYYANKVCQQIDVPLIFHGHNPFERSIFKSAFTGVVKFRPAARGYINTPRLEKLKLLAYYAGQFVRNPAYFNASLPDTLFAYYCAYAKKYPFCSFFDYVKWDEREIMAVLAREYDWEMAADTTSSWRIGDGTAAFYNHIYATMAGLTENDTFQSNCIREGLVSRDEALAVAERENQPRYESLAWYAHTIGFDLDHALTAIDAAPKLYGRRDAPEEYRRGGPSIARSPWGEQPTLPPAWREAG